MKGGRPLRNHYKNLPEMLNSLFPEYNFLIWKFLEVPMNWWASTENHKLFLDWVKQEKQIKDISDWFLPCF